MQRMYFLMAMVLVLAVALAVPATGQDAKPAVRAELGLSSRAPTAAEAREYGLELKVRYRGQIVRTLIHGGAAHKAKIRPGDALIRLDDNDIYSSDDIRDFVATSEPGRKVKALLKRKGVSRLLSTTITLGEKKISDSAAAVEFRWDFASLGQLEPALAKAKAEGKPVFVGISGAET